MGLFDGFKGLFGSSEPKEQEPTAVEEYNGYTIVSTPAHEDGMYRISGKITKGEQVHFFERADQFTDVDFCSQEMVRKSQQMIDQQGDDIFK